MIPFINISDCFTWITINIMTLRVVYWDTLDDSLVF
jgi:hypothetical protein